ncbi:MAG: glycoside hydrolase family 88 protein [Opitutae bacterium]|nr:glycoside hydrolase family 88 protein [Opitutae bacterium]
MPVLEQAADWQLAHPAPRWKPDGWHYATFYAGVMALVEISAEPRFPAALLAMGEGNGWQPGARRYHADDHAVGQTYADLFAREHAPAMIAPLRARFDDILAHPKDDNLLFDPERNPDGLDRWSWCDALFMAPPAWVKLSQVTGEARYREFAIRQWWVTSDFLYDPAERLYFRDSRFFSRREKNGAKVFWARANGWVLGGLVRMLAALPPAHPARPRFVAQFRAMAGRIAELQSADGFWRSSLLDPAAFPEPESSGTGFFCYALACGLNEGLLDRAEFTPVVARAWAALLSCVKPDGQLTRVQPVGSMPEQFDPDATEPFGVGAFLLAGCQIHRLAARSAP